jgi:nicotinate-nucleotide adenylyltransferase
MCQRLLDSAEQECSTCALELERAGPSYTVDTLRAIHASHPDVQLTLLMGADTALTLAGWREPETLLELADLAVAAREGSARAEVLDAIAPLLAGAQPGGSDGGSLGIRFLKTMDPMGISSSMVRERVARGEPIEELVGPGVASYIAEHRLYREPAEAFTP